MPANKWKGHCLKSEAHGARGAFNLMIILWNEWLSHFTKVTVFEKQHFVKGIVLWAGKWKQHSKVTDQYTTLHLFPLRGMES